MLVLPFLRAFLESFCFLESQALKYNLLAPALGRCRSARGAGRGSRVWMQTPPPGSITSAHLQDWPFPKHLISQTAQQFIMCSTAHHCISRCRGVSGCASPSLTGEARSMPVASPVVQVKGRPCQRTLLGQRVQRVQWRGTGET